jgi:hypothetical protein
MLRIAKRMSDLRSAIFMVGLGAFTVACPAAALSADIAHQARQTGTISTPGASPDDPGGWPKLGLETIANLEYAGFAAQGGPSRGPDLRLRFDSTFLAQFNDSLSLDGLFQFKPRQPLPASDPNHDLFINQGPARNEGGKMKELYVRSGDYRIGKFVQDFGRAYVLLPGPQAADFTEESEQGYEPTEMIGVEKIHVFDSEDEGWRQLSLSAFMVDRTFLHQSFPYNEGMIHYADGGIGNTRLPENFMATWDVLNQPVGGWAHLNYQASAIRWGKTFGAQQGEWWTTLGGDISVPLQGSVEDTLRGNYSQLHFYVEGARRDNFEGVSGRARDFLSASAEYMMGQWVADLTTTQRWTTNGNALLQKDELYTGSIGYTLPSRTVAALSIGHEIVGSHQGLYVGIRLTQTLTTCSMCSAKDPYY